MREILARPSETPGGLVCTTQPAAISAIRACHEAGLIVGKDISICTINNEPTGRYFCPSLTGLEMPDLRAILEQCFKWFSRPGQPWQGGLTLVPRQPHFFAGESTGKPKRMAVPAAKAGRVDVVKAKRKKASCRRKPIPDRP